MKIFETQINTKIVPSFLQLQHFKEIQTRMSCYYLPSFKEAMIWYILKLI